MTNVPGNSCTEIQKNILWSNKFFHPKKSLRLWEIREKYFTTGRHTDDNITRRMRFACAVPKATNTHSEYVILIVFPLQKWWQEKATLSRYTYVACRVHIWCALNVSRQNTDYEQNFKNFHICTEHPAISKVFHYQLMHKPIVFKGVLNFTLTLQQLQHVSVWSPSSGVVLCELANGRALKRLVKIQQCG